MHPPFLLVLCGIPCSGKSTLAKKIAEAMESQHAYNTAIISSDNFRRMLPIYEHDFNPDLETFVREATYKTIQEALRQRFIVISDDINYYRSIRRRLKRMAEQNRADFAIIHVNTPLETAIAWNKERENPIPTSVIEEVYYKMDKPGEKYRWDTPILTFDSNQDDLAAAIKITVSKVHEKIQGRATTEAKSTARAKPTPRREGYDRETRRAMSEVMKRYKSLDLARAISDLRKRVIDEAFKEHLSLQETTTLFFNRVEELLKVKESYAKGTSIHIGLFGHVDHGKTQLARCLTEKPSTASLDKHPQAQERGMSIDIGFSAFNLKDFLVTLVDLPGHYSLIKHALAGVNIIDVGLLVIAADEGPMVQTMEHLQILDAAGVKKLVVAINKVDLVDETALDAVKKRVENLLFETRFTESPVTEISAINCMGIDDLKKTLAKNISAPVRYWSGDLKIPISHAFHIYGMGTVVTGTILRGQLRVGDKIEAVPIKKICRVRSLQVFGEDVEEATAGDRIGITLTNIRPQDVSRGDLIITPSTMSEKVILNVELMVDHRFRRKVNVGDQVHVSVGLRTVVGHLYPYTTLGEKKILKRFITPGRHCKAFIKIKPPLPVEVGDKALLIKLDLSPKRSRIVGVADVKSLPETPEIYAAKIKRGHVQRKTQTGHFLVSGLFRTKNAAKHVSDEKRKIYASKTKVKGTIVEPSGNRGDVLVEFESPPEISEEALYYRLKRIKLD